MYLEVVEAMSFGYYTILKLSSWSRTWVAFSELTASISQLNRHPKLSTNWPVIWKPRFPSNITQLLYPIPSPQYSITPEPNTHTNILLTISIHTHITYHILHVNHLILTTYQAGVRRFFFDFTVSPVYESELWVYL